jgi:hypothetical protein
MRKEIECEVFGINLNSFIEYGRNFTVLHPEAIYFIPERICFSIIDISKEDCELALFCLGKRQQVTAKYKNNLFYFYIVSLSFSDKDADIEGVLIGETPDFT